MKKNINSYLLLLPTISRGRIENAITAGKADRTPETWKRAAAITTAILQTLYNNGLLTVTECETLTKYYKKQIKTA